MMNASKKTVKGFTIIEMIVVIAIITILLGVLAPSLMVTYRQSRVNSANADAKMVYNAAQTEIIHYMSKDRVSADADKSGFSDSMWISYDPKDGIKFSKQGEVDSAASFETATNGSVAYEIGNKVNRSVSGASNVCWAVYVNNYIVKASVSSNSASSNCIGYYSANKTRADSYSSGNYASTYVSLLKTNSGVYNDYSSPKD